MTPFNQKALELLKDTAILAQQQELDELIIIASTADDSTIQVMTGTPVSTLESGVCINFVSANPPFFINPRWIKKITFRKATN